MQNSPGRYVVEIMDHSLTEAKKGTLQLAFKIGVVGMVDPTDPENLSSEGAGTERTIFRPITEKTASWVWQDLDRLGFSGDDFVALDREQAAAAGKEFASLAGKQVHARCTPNEWDGKVTERWDFDMGGGPNLQPAGQAKVREASAMFNRKRVQQTSGNKTAVAAAAPTGDVPF